MKKLDLKNKRFGKLVVIRKIEQRKNGGIWECQCDCGNKTFVYTFNLRSKHTQSCGCLVKETNTKHNKSRTRLYPIWRSVKDRCYNPNVKAYKNYGGRGITVCEEWKNNFQAFYNWAIANGYDKNAEQGECTLDRIDVNGNYEPSNCRWVAFNQQQNNRRDNHYLTYCGETHTMSEWAKIKGISYSTLSNRINCLHWDVEKSLSVPVTKKTK